MVALLESQEDQGCWLCQPDILPDGTEIHPSIIEILLRLSFSVSVATLALIAVSAAMLFLIVAVTPVLCRLSYVDECYGPYKLGVYEDCAIIIVLASGIIAMICFRIIRSRERYVEVAVAA